MAEYCWSLPNASEKVARDGSIERTMSQKIALPQCSHLSIIYVPATFLQPSVQHSN